jgi:hypothetical protein
MPGGLIALAVAVATRTIPDSRAPGNRGFASTAATVLSVHAVPARRGSRFGSVAGGHGIPALL